MAYGFNVFDKSLDPIRRTEGRLVGDNIVRYVGTPSQGTILAAHTFVTGGTFNVFVDEIYMCASVDCEILINVINANGIEEFDAVTNRYKNLITNVENSWACNRMFLYNQTVQFVFQYFKASPTSIVFRAGYTGSRMFMNRNPYAKKVIKIIGDSIAAGADSSSTNAKPYGSWVSQVVYNHYGATLDVKGVQKSVGGLSAENIDKASITGDTYCQQASLVFIALGTNPDSSDEIYRTSINNILNRELVYHPGAWFILCAPIVKDSAGETQNVIYRGILQEIVGEKNNPRIKYLPFDDLGILPGVIPSNVHPNQDGHDDMFVFASNFLTTNNVVI